MTSTDMITSLASMTSTASLASKNQKLLALWLLDDFPAIRNLSSLNDLNSLNDLSGLNGFNLSKHLLSMMLPLTWQQNDLPWSLNVEWIIKSPQFYGFLALFLLEAVEAMYVAFNQIWVSKVKFPHLMNVQIPFLWLKSVFLMSNNWFEVWQSVFKHPVLPIRTPWLHWNCIPILQVNIH